MTGLPKAAQEAVDRANEIQSQLANPESNSAPNPDNIKDESSEVSIPEQKEAQSNNQGSKDNDPVYWRNRFNILQGKYNSEVPALNQKVHTLESEMEKLKASGQPADLVAQMGDLTPEEIEDYGEDFIRVMQKIAKQSQTSIPELGEIAKKIDRLESTTAQDAEAQFFADLERVVPNYSDINKSKDFFDWLSGTDPMSGITRQEMLNKGRSALNASQVSLIFNAYIKQSRAKTSFPENKVHPQNANSSYVPNESASITRASIKAFYTAVSKGEYRGRDQERLAREKEIQNAVAHNKVVG